MVSPGGCEGYCVQTFRPGQAGRPGEGYHWRARWEKSMSESAEYPGSKRRVALDAMGGDNAPGEIVAGAVLAAREYGTGVILVGREDAIRAELAKHDTQGLDLPIIHTDEVIAMEEHDPAAAAREKRNASMLLALQQVRDGAALGAVSAGNSGAMMAAATIVLRRFQGVKPPAPGARPPTKPAVSLCTHIAS